MHAVWRGALLWALALVRAPECAARQAGSQPRGPVSIPETWSANRVLVLSSLLLALAMGRDNPAGIAAGPLGPGWASSLGVVVLGWSLLLLTLTSAATDN